MVSTRVLLFLLRHTGYPPCLTLPSRGSLSISALDNSCPRGAAPQVISVRYDKSKLSTSGCLANISATGGTTDKWVTLKKIRSNLEEFCLTFSEHSNF